MSLDSINIHKAPTVANGAKKFHPGKIHFHIIKSSFYALQTNSLAKEMLTTEMFVLIYFCD